MQVMEKPPQEKELLTVDDLAEILGVTKYTVRRYFHEGVLPGFQIGRIWYIRRETWERYKRKLEQQDK